MQHACERKQKTERAIPQNKWRQCSVVSVKADPSLPLFLLAFVHDCLLRLLFFLDSFGVGLCSVTFRNLYIRTTCVIRTKARRERPAPGDAVHVAGAAAAGAPNALGEGTKGERSAKCATHA